MAQSCRKGCHTWSIESTHVGNFQCNLCPKHGKLLLLRCRMLLRRNSSDFGFGTGIAADSELSCSSNFSWILLHHTGERIFSSTWQQYTNIEKLYQALPSAKLDPFGPFYFEVQCAKNLPRHQQPWSWGFRKRSKLSKLSSSTLPHLVQFPNPITNMNNTWGVKSQCKHQPPKC